MKTNKSKNLSYNLPNKNNECFNSNTHTNFTDTAQQITDDDWAEAKKRLAELIAQTKEDLREEM